MVDFPLTSGRLSGILVFPNLVRPARRLAIPQYGCKDSGIFISAIRPRLLACVFDIGGKLRPDVRETQAALSWPGSVFRLFAFKTPQTRQVPYENHRHH